MKTHPILLQTPPALPLPYTPLRRGLPLLCGRLPPLHARRPPGQGFSGAGLPKQSDLPTPARTRSDVPQNDDDNDDKIPDAVWRRMITRILVSVGVPLGTGLALLQLLDVLKQQGVWDFPLWVAFLAMFLTFGASALGIAYGSLSTSLDAEEKGSLLGLEQLEKNWDEMWNEENSS